MNWAANSTIKGFYYQFNKTLLEVLCTDSGVIIPEGLIEDIDVITDDSYKAIQCKYHENLSGYEESVLYQPILEMLLSYSNYEDGGHNNIEYILYVHLEDSSISSINIDIDFVNRMLKSNNKELITKYICKLLNITDPVIKELVDKAKRTDEDKKKIIDYISTNRGSLGCIANVPDFLDHFSLDIGDSYSELEGKVKQKMKSLDMDDEEINILFYPNAINEIAEHSKNGSPKERAIDKISFINKIKNGKKILVTKWTKRITEYNKLLKYKKRELSASLQVQTRKRIFIISASIITNDDYVLSCFLQDYLQFYKRKPTQTSIPMFFIEGCTEDFLDSTESQLYRNGICANNGKVGSLVNEHKLFDFDNYAPNSKLALCMYKEDIDEMINHNPPDDIFVVGKISVEDFSGFSNVEMLDVNGLSDLAYLLNMRKVV